MTNFTEKVRQYVELDKEKKELKSKLNIIQGVLTNLEEDVLEAFIEEGATSITVAGRTVSPRVQVWVSPKDGDYETACKALEAAGLGQFTGKRFNTQTVSSYVREILSEGDELPPELADVLKVTERHTISVRK